jgi:hypothetical protein
VSGQQARIALILLLHVAMLAGGCASERRAGPPDPIAQAISQPLHDVSLLQETVPGILTAARAAPYNMEGVESCDLIARDIKGLSDALGPDVDYMDRGRPSDSAGLTASAIGGVIGLPFRGAIRTISGASERDSKVAEAVLAGMVRRGFLKGVAIGRACNLSFETE